MASENPNKYRGVRFHGGKLGLRLDGCADVLAKRIPRKIRKFHDMEDPDFPPQRTLRTTEKQPESFDRSGRRAPRSSSPTAAGRRKWIRFSTQADSAGTSLCRNWNPTQRMCFCDSPSTHSGLNSNCGFSYFAWWQLRIIVATVDRHESKHHDCHAISLIP